jgi:hypothetical protein
VSRNMSAIYISQMVREYKWFSMTVCGVKPQGDSVPLVASQHDSLSADLLVIMYCNLRPYQVFKFAVCQNFLSKFGFDRFLVGSDAASVSLLWWIRLRLWIRHSILNPDLHSLKKLDPDPHEVNAAFLIINRFKFENILKTYAFCYVRKKLLFFHMYILIRARYKTYPHETSPYKTSP